MLIIVALIMIVVVFQAKKIAIKQQGKAPKGVQNLVEILILFIRDDIAIPSIGKKRYKKFMPYLLTAFCFIFLSNIMGLIPFFPVDFVISGGTLSALSCKDAVSIPTHPVTVGNDVYAGILIWSKSWAAGVVSGLLSVNQVNRETTVLQPLK